MIHVWAIAGAAFLACGVECVEALTIVLAVTFTQGFRPAMQGTLLALLALGGVVASGIPVLHLIPTMALKIAVGAFLIWFGWGWLRKAVLRAAGRMGHRDEAAAYAKKVAELQQKREERLGRITAFNGVFVEGLEVALIVLAIGGANLSSELAAIGGASAAFVLVVATAVALRSPLSRVPENVMKYIVGVMIVTFGVYWLGEGAGLAWPGDDLAILYVGAFVLAASYAVVLTLRTQAARTSSRA